MILAALALGLVSCKQEPATDWAPAGDNIMTNEVQFLGGGIAVGKSNNNLGQLTASKPVRLLSARVVLVRSRRSRRMGLGLRRSPS